METLSKKWETSQTVKSLLSPSQRRRRRITVSNGTCISHLIKSNESPLIRSVNFCVENSPWILSHDRMAKTKKRGIKNVSFTLMTREEEGSDFPGTAFVVCGVPRWTSHSRFVHFVFGIFNLCKEIGCRCFSLEFNGLVFGLRNSLAFHFATVASAAVYIVGRLRFFPFSFSPALPRPLSPRAQSRIHNGASPSLV